MTEQGIVNIRGREYQTVALRIKNFREKHPDWGIRTQIIGEPDKSVLMIAQIWNGEFLVATGHAEEVRGQSNINKTSAIENCETSAIGRALACLGYGGTEFASADEVQNAIQQQGNFISDKQVKVLTKLVQETDSDNPKFYQFAKAHTIDTILTTDFDRIHQLLLDKKARMEDGPGADG